MKTTVKTGKKSSVEVDQITNLVCLSINRDGSSGCEFLTVGEAHVLGSALIRLAEKIEAEQAERAAA